MRKKLSVTRIFLLVALATLAVLTNTSRAYAADCLRDPNNLLNDLDNAINLRATIYNWPSCLDPTFNNWAIGASENKPVLSAAIGLYKLGPNALVQGGTRTYYNWWKQFLASQTGQQNPPETAALRYFKGREAMSNTYEGYVLASVLSVRYWAQTNPGQDPNGALASLARRYLRATWVIYALVAGRDDATSYWVDQFSTSTGAPVAQPLAGFANSGPYVALAGGRSTNQHFTEGYRTALLARAIDWIPQNKRLEAIHLRPLIDSLVTKWNALGLQENLYGLNATERGKLRDLIITGNGVSFFVPSWLDGIRTRKVFRLLAWPNGDRASIMEGNPNGFTVCIYGAYYKLSEKRTYFLYPWVANNVHSPVVPGWARVESNMIIASNDPGNSTHPMKIVSAQTPLLSTRIYQVVISPDGPPYIEGSTGAPPPAPPHIDPFDPTLEP